MIQIVNDSIEAAAMWNYEYMRFAEKYEVPMWIGEFVSQYNTGEEDIRRIVKSFAFDNCIINQEFVEILKNI